MKLSSIYLAAILGLGAMTGPIAAQDHELVFSEQQTAMCMAQAELVSEMRECIGKSADACTNANDMGGSTIGMAGCISMELEYWDRQLNEVYAQAKQAAARIDTENEVEKYGMLSSLKTMQDMQRAWIPYRDAWCLFETSLWGQGTGAGGAQAGCIMVVTAEQTLVLLDFVRSH